MKLFRGHPHAHIEPVPYRLRIGVTGKRLGLPPLRELRPMILEAVSQRVRELYPESQRRTVAKAFDHGHPPVAYSVLSALAEGADRIVARTLMREKKARLDAVLPMVEADYLQDFRSGWSKRQFRLLLGCSLRPAWRRDRLIGDDYPDAREAEDGRRASYEAAGQFIVDQCDVLIAVWDGTRKPSDGRGGTVDIVDYAVAQGRPVIRVWLGVCVVHHAGHGLDAEALRQIERYNSRSVAPREIQRSREEFFEKPKASGYTPVDAVELVEKTLLPHYARASDRAKLYRDLCVNTGSWMYISAVLSLTSGFLGRHFGSHGREGLLSEQFAAGLESVFLVTILSFRHLVDSWRGAWMRNRFLAERIRCMVMAAVAGVETRAVEVPPYLGAAHSTNEWMVRVGEELRTSMPASVETTIVHNLDVREYVAEWLKGQIDHHHNKSATEKAKYERLEHLGVVLFCGTLIVALLGFGMARAEKEPDQIWVDLMSLVTSIFPAAAAAAMGIQSFREHRRLEKRSESMTRELRGYRRRVLVVNDPAKFTKLILEIDELMLRENQDWLGLMRYVEVKAG